jgi:hypothetical protein
MKYPTSVIEHHRRLSKTDERLVLLQFEFSDGGKKTSQNGAPRSEIT